MKWVSYSISWLLYVYGFSIAINAGVSGFLTWYYQLGLPTITPRLYLLIWIGTMVLMCVFLAVYGGGLAIDHYGNNNKFPLTVIISNQILSALTYILLAYISNFKGLYYFPSAYLEFVINEFYPDIITNENHAIWTAALMLFHTVAFIVAGMVPYLRERKRLIEKYNKAMSNI